MNKRPKPQNRKHGELMQRARCAMPGQRRARQRELVHYVARKLAPGLCRKRGFR